MPRKSERLKLQSKGDMHETSQSSGAAEPLLATKSQISSNSTTEYGSTGKSVNQDDDTDFPSVTWVRARHDAMKRQLPQNIAHRGYKAAFPENTLRAFRGAVEVGAHALETDIHLTKDEVVVLSHDPDLKRCFGQPEKIINSDWDYVQGLRTIQSPHEPMPRLRDLLEYLAQPEQQHVWLLLDIKIDNDAEKVMKLIAETLRSVDPGVRPWKERVVLGIWVARFLPLCVSYLPGYPVSYIGLINKYARQFLEVPNISFNMLQRLLLGRAGNRFINDIQAAGRSLFLWTVNDDNMMKWAVQKKVDGVITDDPKKFKEICDHWRDDEPPAKATWPQWLYSIWVSMLVMFYARSFRKRFAGPVEKHLLRSEDVRIKASLSLGT